MSGAILVVEDEPITQKLIAVNLERAGHQVMRAANVPEAVASIRKVLPDIWCCSTGFFPTRPE